MNRLAQLAALGTSVWLDGLVPPEDLERLVAEDSVTGLTSNPTIFRAALAGSERYAARIAALHDLPPENAFETLAVEEARTAADVLEPVHVAIDRANAAFAASMSELLAGFHSPAPVHVQPRSIR